MDLPLGRARIQSNEVQAPICKAIVMQTQATSLGIQVSNIPSGASGNALSCAEMAIYLLLCCLRCFCHALDPYHHEAMLVPYRGHASKMRFTAISDIKLTLEAHLQASQGDGKVNAEWGFGTSDWRYHLWQDLLDCWVWQHSKGACTKASPLKISVSCFHDGQALTGNWIQHVIRPTASCDE